MTEKRAFDRHTLWFPVTLDSEDSHVWAVCHDVSAGGIALSGSEKLRVGSIVTVVFRIAPDDPAERRVKGKVVRVDGLDDGPRTVWRYRMAVEFDEPVPELQALFKRASTLPPPAL